MCRVTASPQQLRHASIDILTGRTRQGMDGALMAAALGGVREAPLAGLHRARMMAASSEELVADASASLPMA